MTADPFEYDVGVSFAREDRTIAQELTELLARKNVSVFQDEYRVEDADRWGKDLVDHLVNLYARKVRYCVLLLSQSYPLKTWTKVERMSARERALRDPDEYILPILLDQSEVPGAAEAKGYRDLRQHSVEGLAVWLEEKLKEREIRSGPPSASHDLRSGNIPSQKS